MSTLKSNLQSKLTATGQSVKVVWTFEETPKLGQRADYLSAKTEIFEICVDELNKSELIVAVLDGPQVDDGTAWEIGYFHSRHGSEHIFGLRTDLRNAGDLAGGRINSLIEASCSSISTTENDLLAAIARALEQGGS